MVWPSRGPCAIRSGRRASTLPLLSLETSVVQLAYMLFPGRRLATFERLLPGFLSALCLTALTLTFSTISLHEPFWRMTYPELKGKFVLLFFGRVHVKKGLDLLAEALHRLYLISPSFTCSWLGMMMEPGSRSTTRLSNLVSHTRVTYIGHVGRRPSPPGLGSSRCFCPTQLQRGVQYGNPRSFGLFAALFNHYCLSLSRAG